MHLIAYSSVSSLFKERVQLVSWVLVPRWHLYERQPRTNTQHTNQCADHFASGLEGTRTPDLLIANEAL